MQCIKATKFLKIQKTCVRIFSGFACRVTNPYLIWKVLSQTCARIFSGFTCLVEKIPRYLIWKVLNQSNLCAHIFRICVPRVHQTFANIFRICLPRDKPIPVHAHIFRICVPRNKTLPVHHTCVHISGFTCRVTKPYLYITPVRIFQDLPAT